MTALGRRTAAELLSLVPIDDIRDASDARPNLGDVIEVCSRVRPALVGGRAALLVEALDDRIPRRHSLPDPWTRQAG